MSSLLAPLATDHIVKELEPLLIAHREDGEANRKVAPAVARAMLEARVFQSLIPKAYGGLDLSPIDGLQLYEAIARIDAAAGWLAANQSGITTLVALLGEGAADEIFADGTAMFAGALFPPGAAHPVEGGYRVTGRWPFASGCDYATWMVGSTIIMDGEQPRMGPHGGPLMMAAVFPSDEAEVIDTWHTLGMRGTGSSDIAANDVFVPERRTWVVGPPIPRSPAFSAPIFRLGFWPIAAANASVAIGIARAALDDMVALASKQPAYSMTSVGDRSLAQDRLARARATLEAARSYLYTAAEDASASLRPGQMVDPQPGMSLSLAGAFAMEAARSVVDSVHSMAGTSAIRTGMRFQQYFRDIHTLTQHAFSSEGRFESIGKLMVGRETDWPFYSF